MAKKNDTKSTEGQTNADRKQDGGKGKRENDTKQQEVLRPSKPPNRQADEQKQKGDQESSGSWFRAHRLELSIAGGIIVVGAVVMWGYLLATGKGFSDLFTWSTAGTTKSGVEQSESADLRLDGTPYIENGEFTYPVAMMIENLPTVRPQAGLSDASIVYEALVEGGATRFLAVFEFEGREVPLLGPVRSARPYYVEWVSELDALYAHIGGSPEANEIIDAFGIKDMNALYSSGARFFYRDTSKYAPHNLYTSMELMMFALRDKELAGVIPEYPEWTFKQDAKKSDRPSEVPSLTIDFSGGAYQVVYDYDPATNDYARVNGGLPHTDENTGEQIHVKNVVVQVIPPILEVGEQGRLRLDVSGEGRAVIARDGTVVEGTWEKEDRTDRTMFYDAQGDAIDFNSGSTWIAVLPETQSVTYE